MKMRLSGNVKFFLEVQSQLKVLHWQTKSHAKHHIVWRDL